MGQLKDILDSKISLQDEKLNESQKQACYSAMTHYAALKIDEYRSSENKSVNLEAIKLFPALWKGDFKLWLRKRSFLKSKSQAQIKADIEGRPFYVIRATEISYVVQSTLDARILRKKRFYAKDVNSQKLIETSDCVCYPSNRSNIGHGFTASEFNEELKHKKLKNFKR